MLEERTWKDKKTINFTTFNGNPPAFCFFEKEGLKFHFSLGPTNCSRPCCCLQHMTSTCGFNLAASVSFIF